MSVLAKDRNGNVVQAIKPGTSQKVAYTAVAGTSAAVGGITSLVAIQMSSTGFFKVGAAAVADGTCMRLPADTVLFVPVQAGQTISFIKETNDGNAFITEGV